MAAMEKSNDMEAPPVGKVDIEEKEAKVSWEMMNVTREAEAYKKLIQQTLQSSQSGRVGARSEQSWTGSGIENADWTRVKRRLCDHYEKMKNFISTKSQPTIFWMPKKPSKKSEKALASTQRALQRKIDGLQGGTKEMIFQGDGDGERMITKQGVDEIDWSSKQLRWLPESFCLLKSVQVLSLSHNRLSSLPMSFGDLAALQILDLQGNRLANLPDSFGDLSELRMLGVRANRLIKLPECFCQLASLQTLDARFNRLTKLPEGFGQLEALREVDFHANRLTELPQSFTNLSELEVLHLYGNNLTSLPSSFGKLKALEELDLNGNQLTELPASFTDLGSLSVSDLGRNQLSSLPESISKLKSLQELLVQGNQLATLPSSFANLVKLLEVLDLEGNPLVEPPLDVCCNGLDAISRYYALKEQPQARNSDEPQITKVTISPQQPQQLLQRVLQKQRAGLMMVKTEPGVKTEMMVKTEPEIEEAKTHKGVPSGHMRAWDVDDSPEAARTVRGRTRSRPGRSLTVVRPPVSRVKEELQEETEKPVVKLEVVENDQAQKVKVKKDARKEIRRRSGVVEAELSENDLDVEDDEGPTQQANGKAPPAKKARQG